MSKAEKGKKLIATMTGKVICINGFIFCAVDIKCCRKLFCRWVFLTYLFIFVVLSFPLLYFFIISLFWKTKSEIFQHLLYFRLLLFLTFKHSLVPVYDTNMFSSFINGAFRSLLFMYAHITRAKLL